MRKVILWCFLIIFVVVGCNSNATNEASDSDKVVEIGDSEISSESEKTGIKSEVIEREVIFLSEFIPYVKPEVVGLGYNEFYNLFEEEDDGNVLYAVQLTYISYINGEYPDDYPVQGKEESYAQYCGRCEKYMIEKVSPLLLQDGFYILDNADDFIIVGTMEKLQKTFDNNLKGYEEWFIEVDSAICPEDKKIETDSKQVVVSVPLITSVNCEEIS